MDEVAVQRLLEETRRALEQAQQQITATKALTRALRQDLGATWSEHVVVLRSEQQTDARSMELQRLQLQRTMYELERLKANSYVISAFPAPPPDE